MQRRTGPEDLRHPAVDLPAARQRRDATGPYVINLSTSNAPFSMPLAKLPNSDHLHVHQVQRVEDGRLRFRLRLGPIMSELEADAVLGTVLHHYPFALTATAGEDDLNAIAAAVLVRYRTTKQVVEFAGSVPNAGPENLQESQAVHAYHDSVNGMLAPPRAGTAVRSSTVAASQLDAHPRNHKSLLAPGLVDTQSVITTSPPPPHGAPTTEAVKPVKVEESQRNLTTAPTLGDVTMGSILRSVGPQIRPEPLIDVDSTQTMRAHAD
jgi:hypothetical protein